VSRRSHASVPTLRSGRNSGDTVVVRAVPGGEEGERGWCRERRFRRQGLYAAYALCSFQEMAALSQENVQELIAFAAFAVFNTIFTTATSTALQEE
jgi:hypothetical protein